METATAAVEAAGVLRIHGRAAGKQQRSAQGQRNRANSSEALHNFTLEGSDLYP
jgi:hypothetical protein